MRAVALGFCLTAASALADLLPPPQSRCNVVWDPCVTWKESRPGRCEWTKVPARAYDQPPPWKYGDPPIAFDTILVCTAVPEPPPPPPRSPWVFAPLGVAFAGLVAVLIWRRRKRKLTTPP